MSYDITMCDNADCALREQCYYYVAYRRYKADKNPDKPPFVYLFDWQGVSITDCDRFLVSH